MTGGVGDRDAGLFDARAVGSVGCDDGIALVLVDAGVPHGVPSWSDGSRSWQITETLLLEGTSWECQVHEAAVLAAPSSWWADAQLAVPAARTQLMHCPLGSAMPR